MENQRKNIFSEFITAFYDFKWYKNFAKNTGGKVFLFSLFLIFVSLMLSYTFPAIIGNFRLDSGGIKGYLDKNIPYFYFEDSEFYIEEPYSFEGNGTYVNFNSNLYSDEALDIADIISNNSTVLIMDAEKAIIKSKGQVETVFYSNIDESMNFSKDDLISLVPLFYVIFVIFLIVTYILLYLKFIIGALIIAVITKFIIAAAAKTSISFGEAFNLTVYSRTMPIVLAGVLSLFSIKIHYMFLISAVISFVYLFFALKNISQNNNIDKVELNSQNGSF